MVTFLVGLLLLYTFCNFLGLLKSRFGVLVERGLFGTTIYGDLVRGFGNLMGRGIFLFGLDRS